MLLVFTIITMKKWLQSLLGQYAVNSNIGCRHPLAALSQAPLCCIPIHCQRLQSPDPSMTAFPAVEPHKLTVTAAKTVSITVG